MRAAGLAANDAAAKHAATDVQKRKAANTITAHLGDLALFSRYLHSIAQVAMPDAETLRTEPAAWVGVTWGMVAGFVRWLEGEGYAASTISRALSTVKTYVKIAAQAGIITPDELVMVRVVQGYGNKEGKRLDEVRTEAGVPVRRAQVARESHRGTKAAHTVTISDTEARALKTHPDTPQGRRDALLMCLLLEHGLRESEAVGLTVDGVDLTAKTIGFYRPKTGENATQEMTPATLRAMRAWFDSGDVPAMGPILRASRKGGALADHAMSMSAIRSRVRALGERVGVVGLSPHDCRHHWACSMAKMEKQGKLSLFQFQEMGGWSSLAMPRRYVERLSVPNAGVDYSDL